MADIDSYHLDPLGTMDWEGGGQPQGWTPKLRVDLAPALQAMDWEGGGQPQGWTPKLRAAAPAGEGVMSGERRL